MDIRKITAAASKRSLSDIHALQDYFECIRLLCDEDEQEAHRFRLGVRSSHSQIDAFEKAR